MRQAHHTAFVAGGEGARATGVTLRRSAKPLRRCAMRSGRAAARGLAHRATAHEARRCAPPAGVTSRCGATPAGCVSTTYLRRCCRDLLAAELCAFLWSLRRPPFETCTASPTMSNHLRPTEDQRPKRSVWLRAVLPWLALGLGVARADPTQSVPTGPSDLSDVAGHRRASQGVAALARCPAISHCLSRSRVQRWRNR